MLLFMICTVFIGIKQTQAQVASQGLTQGELDIFESYGIVISDDSATHWLMEHVGIPDHDHGPFPADGNPNSVGEQNHDYSIPKNPTWEETPGCLPQGIIAMAKSGIPFFNPYTAEGLNAITNEVFDDCQGHPDPQSTYHYHQMPSCLYQGGNNELMGVALDGYPIYGPKDENGQTLTTADLDFCHGRWFNGRYQYHATHDFPYVLACYRGQSSRGENPLPGRKKRQASSSSSDVLKRVLRQMRPPRPDQQPPGGNQDWNACYAYCENPAQNSQTGCVEPDYQVEVVAPTIASSTTQAQAITPMPSTSSDQNNGEDVETPEATNLESGATQGLTQQELDMFETYGVVIDDYSPSQWLLEHTGIPNHETGDFPNQENPNSIGQRDHDYYIPKVPTWEETPQCLQQGIIGMAKSGVPFFNPYTAQGLNAVTNEVFDDCEGHPDPLSTYHYHQMPSCLYSGGHNELMGVALDGYPIYGPRDEHGDVLTTADLDFCHGRWHNGRYQYHVTSDFPYVMACYRGLPTAGSNPMGRRKRDIDDTQIEELHPRFKRQMPGQQPGQGGNQNWEACYAYCENPAQNTETGCSEPIYTEGGDEGYNSTEEDSNETDNGEDSNDDDSNPVTPTSEDTSSGVHVAPHLPLLFFTSLLLYSKRQ